MNDEKTTVIENEIPQTNLEAVPLCLKDYFAERDDGKLKRNKSGPPGMTRARIAERWENVIVLAFDEVKTRTSAHKIGRWYELCVLGLLIVCLAAIGAAFVK